MSTVHWWTGLEVRALRKAFLMPVRSFAEHIGVGATTVSDWEQKGPDARLRLSSQRLLAGELARAPDEVRARFEVVLGASTQVAVGTPAAGHVGAEIAAATDPAAALPDSQIDAIAEFGASLGLSFDEARTIANVAGDLVELELHLEIDIARDGHAALLYRHRLFNLADRPVTRLTREVWFKHTSKMLSIDPVPDGGTNVMIQRVHDTPTLAKFACQVSPAIPPGGTAIVQYTVKGGRFADELYWRQATPRYVRRMTIMLVHRRAGRLRSCSAVEEHGDGSENSAGEGLSWRYEGLDLVVTLTRGDLRPNQALTLRWDVDRETPR